MEEQDRQMEEEDGEKVEAWSSYCMLMANWGVKVLWSYFAASGSRVGIAIGHSYRLSGRSVRQVWQIRRKN